MGACGNWSAGTSWRTAIGATSTRANVSYPSKSQPSQDAMRALQTDASIGRVSAIAMGLPPRCPHFAVAVERMPCAPTDPRTARSGVLYLEVLPGADPVVLRDRPNYVFDLRGGQAGPGSDGEHVPGQRDHEVLVEQISLHLVDQPLALFRVGRGV